MTATVSRRTPFIIWMGYIARRAGAMVNKALDLNQFERHNGFGDRYITAHARVNRPARCGLPARGKPPRPVRHHQGPRL